MNQFSVVNYNMQSGLIRRKLEYSFTYLGKNAGTLSLDINTRTHTAMPKIIHTTLFKRNEQQSGVIKKSYIMFICV